MTGHRNTIKNSIGQTFIGYRLDPRASELNKVPVEYVQCLETEAIRQDFILSQKAIIFMLAAVTS
jgi:hypothetical protein